jgi:hypothetical protein
VRAHSACVHLRDTCPGSVPNQISLHWVIYFAAHLGSGPATRAHLRLSVFRNVSDDWVTALPGEKARHFDAAVRRWEYTYAMMSIALDDALSFRSRGELVCARQQVSIAADLLGRLSYSLVSLCGTLSRLGRRLAELPAVEPLNTNFFRGNTGQSAASWNGILHHVLFGTRSRFFHKVRILSDTVDQIEDEFRDVAVDISRGLTVHPGDCWGKLDSLHYDFNTCMRETEVVLKSFLRVLPAEHVPGLCTELNAIAEPDAVRMKPRLSRASA